MATGVLILLIIIYERMVDFLFISIAPAVAHSNLLASLFMHIYIRWFN